MRGPVGWRRRAGRRRRHPRLAAYHRPRCVELIASEYQPAAFARLHGGYTYLSEAFRLKPGSRDLTMGASEYNDPAHQVWGRANLDLPRGLETDAVFRFVGALPRCRATPS